MKSIEWVYIEWGLVSFDLPRVMFAYHNLPPMVHPAPPEPNQFAAKLRKRMIANDRSQEKMQS